MQFKNQSFLHSFIRQSECCGNENEYKIRKHNEREMVKEGEWKSEAKLQHTKRKFSRIFCCKGNRLTLTIASVAFKFYKNNNNKKKNMNKNNDNTLCNP